MAKARISEGCLTEFFTQWIEKTNVFNLASLDSRFKVEDHWIQYDSIFFIWIVNLESRTCARRFKIAKNYRKQKKT